MTLEELKQNEWYKERPLVIQEAINILPPIELYKFKDSGKQCYILSYGEPESGLLEDVTCTVQKTGVGGLLNMPSIDSNRVFGVKLTDLEIF